jgi:hypothetical protein
MSDSNACFETHLKYIIAHAMPAPGLEENCKYIE